MVDNRSASTAQKGVFLLISHHDSSADKDATLADAGDSESDNTITYEKNTGLVQVEGLQVTRKGTPLLKQDLTIRVIAP